MKKLYKIPLFEVLSLAETLEPFCGVSGGEYNPTPGEFDDDSD